MRCTLFILLLCGCAAQKTSGPPLPKLSKSAPRMPEAVSQFTLSYSRDFYLPIQYPPDASNYVWVLQQSLDNSNWTTIQKFSGVISNYNYDVNMGASPVKFWRLKGVK